MPPYRRRHTRACAITSAGPASSASREPGEVLVERHVDGVEERADLRVGALVERRDLPQAGAVEMDRGAALADRRDLRAQIAPVRQLPADLALGKLNQDRLERRVQRLQVRARDQRVAVADERRLEVVQVRVAPPPRTSPGGRSDETRSRRSRARRSGCAARSTGPSCRWGTAAPPRSRAARPPRARARTRPGRRRSDRPAPPRRAPPPPRARPAPRSAAGRPRVGARSPPSPRAMRPRRRPASPGRLPDRRLPLRAGRSSRR